MLKATFVMSTLSLITSVVTLGLIAGGAKKVHDDVQEVRTKSNQTLNKLKSALNELEL